MHQSAQEQTKLSSINTSSLKALDYQPIDTSSKTKNRILNTNRENIKIKFSNQQNPNHSAIRILQQALSSMQAENARSFKLTVIKAFCLITLINIDLGKYSSGQSLEMTFNDEGCLYDYLTELQETIYLKTAELYQRSNRNKQEMLFGLSIYKKSFHTWIKLRI
jgi:hypothetical protein